MIILMGLAWYGNSLKEDERVKYIADHTFHLGMSAGDVRKSLGEPLRIVPTGQRHETWVYPNVAIDFVSEIVIDSHKTGQALR